MEAGTMAVRDPGLGSGGSARGRCWAARGVRGGSDI